MRQNFPINQRFSNYFVGFEWDLSDEFLFIKPYCIHTLDRKWAPFKKMTFERVRMRNAGVTPVRATITVTK